MKLRTVIAAASLLVLVSSPAMAKTFLIHITTGPDNPTEAALGFTVAVAAQNAGNTVNVFLAGDGASLITDDSIASVVGKGTGKLQDSFGALLKGGARIYISANSAKARDIAPQAVIGKHAEFALPSKLVELASAADVVLRY